jgi:hypothetical protein
LTNSWTQWQIFIVGLADPFRNFLIS